LQLLTIPYLNFFTFTFSHLIEIENIPIIKPASLTTETTLGSMPASINKETLSVTTEVSKNAPTQ
jgi:hypothetical protein